MSADHIETPRLFNAAEGIDLDMHEIDHLRGCPDCREVLSLLTRHNKTRFQHLATGSVRDHVPLPELWRHGMGEAIDGVYESHLTGCEHCSAVLSLCLMRTSLRQVIQILKNRGLRIDDR